jgi:hypothetical protein
MSEVNDYSVVSANIIYFVRNQFSDALEVYLHSPTHTPTLISDFVPHGLNLSDPIQDVLGKIRLILFFVCCAL